MRDRSPELMQPRENRAADPRPEPVRDELAVGRDAPPRSAPWSRVLTRPGRALVALGLLAAGSAGGASAPAAAQIEQDQVIDGTSDPDSQNPADNADNPEIDPGGENNPGVVHEEDPEAPNDGRAPPQAAPPPAQLDEPEPRSPQDEDPATRRPTRTGVRRHAARPRPNGGRAKGRGRDRAIKPPPHPPAPAADRPQASPGRAIPAAPTSPSVPTQGAGATRAPGNAHVHTVRPGESLWRIAASVLGPHASDAEIAREVGRLWEVNEQRIGTGRPDLIRVGTQLRIP